MDLCRLHGRGDRAAQLTYVDPGAWEATNLRDIYFGLNHDLPQSFPEAYPLAPIPLTFGPAVSPSITLYGGSAVWYELAGVQTAPQLLRLAGETGKKVPSTLRLAIARLQ